MCIAEMGSLDMDFLDNKTIFVTGATGFLAKIFVEEILRLQPNVKKLYLLVRATNAESALRRFENEAVAKDLFNVLKEQYGANLQSFLSEKVTVVPGDITCENMGLQDSSMYEQMWSQVDVVVNVAASTKFNERYDIALALNTYGAKFVLDFAKKCVNIKLLLHVSTAYVFGQRSGLIHESPCYFRETMNGTNNLNIEEEKKIIEDKINVLKSDDNSNDKMITLAMKDLGMRRANYHGWPNTYVFTKAMGEMILGQLKGDIPLVIIRPTIVTSTYKEPFPGWVEGLRTIDSFIVAYGKGSLTCVPGNPETIYDVVPTDMVVNAMIASIVAHANQYCLEIIYHIGSSVSNPLKLPMVHKYANKYFNQHPCIDTSGKPVIVGDLSGLRILTSMASFHRYITLRYLLPLKVFKVVNLMLCQAFAKTYKNAERKINLVLLLVKLYEPYLFSTSLYNDMNTDKLRKAVGENVLFFDPRIIDWEAYFLGTHIPGLVKYCI